MKDKKMAESKIDFSFENLHFSCAGDNDWVEKQLNNVLNRIPSLLSIHKKGENVVEEVIEVKAEDVNEEKQEAPQSRFRAGKGHRDTVNAKQPKAEKAAKVKVIREKPIKEKISKAPKIKVARIPKLTKVPKIRLPESPKLTAVQEMAEPKVTDDVVVVKRGRKPGSAAKPISKPKTVKKSKQV